MAGFRRLALAFAAVIPLAGCTTYSLTEYHVDNPYQFFGHAATRGEIPVMILGDPFPGQQAAVQEAVLRALDRNYKSFGNPFRAVQPSAAPVNKVVVAFNSAGAVWSRTVCRDPASVLLPPGGSAPLYIDAIFCGETPYSEMSGTLRSASDPQFLEVVDRLIYGMVPREPAPWTRQGEDRVIPNP